ncbi:hypothetical protein ACFV23_56855, partial [Streptomyces sp. NPDC059627]
GVRTTGVAAKSSTCSPRSAKENGNDPAHGPRRRTRRRRPPPSRAARHGLVRDGRISSVVEYADTHHVAVTLFPDGDAHSPAGTE